MAPLQALKVLARSRSAGFTRDYDAYLQGATPEGEASVAWWNGDGRAVRYRRATSDTGLVYDILFKPGRKSEYWLPGELAPRVVLDIGGNIGIAARYLAHRFPAAQLHLFEPVAANLALARLNLEGSRVQLHDFALGSESGEAEFRLPPGREANRGGYSRFATASGGPAVRARVRAVPEALAALGIGEVDLIKIDVEGAEHDVLAAFPDEVLSRVTWIYGELHGEATDPRLAWLALERLARWFEIDAAKPIRKRNWFFDACNRGAVARFRGFRRRR